MTSRTEGMHPMVSLRTRVDRMMEDRDRDSGIKLRFEGGLVDGTTKWWRGNGKSIRAAALPRGIVFDAIVSPTDNGVRESVYMIDREPQSDGYHIARCIKDKIHGKVPPAPACHRCGDSAKTRRTRTAACYIPGCPFQ